MTRWLAGLSARTRLSRSQGAARRMTGMPIQITTQLIITILLVIQPVGLGISYMVFLLSL